MKEIGIIEIEEEAEVEVEGEIEVEDFYQEEEEDIIEEEEEIMGKALNPNRDQDQMNKVNDIKKIKL